MQVPHWSLERMEAKNFNQNNYHNRNSSNKCNNNHKNNGKNINNKSIGYIVIPYMQGQGKSSRTFAVSMASKCTSRQQSIKEHHFVTKR